MLHFVCFFGQAYYLGLHTRIIIRKTYADESEGRAARQDPISNHLPPSREACILI